MVGIMLLLLILIAIVGGVGLWAKQGRLQSHAADAAPAPDESRPRRVPLLTEAVGYVGTILVLAGRAWPSASAGATSPR